MTDHGSSIQTIAWAVDAFSPNPEFNVQLGRNLRALFPNACIYPVYVLSDQSFASRGFSRILRTALKPAIERRLSRLFCEADARLKFESPRILSEPTSSQDECAHKLVRFAEKIHADMIAVGSHGKRAFARLLGLSFSDSVLRMSQLPVLVAGPSADPISRPPSAVVFATDFSPACAQAYDEILKLAACFQAELHLFYKSNPGEQNKAFRKLFLAPETFWPFQASLADPGDEIRSIAGEWMERAESSGVKTSLTLENFRESTSQAIVHYLSRLKDQSALVAMVSQAGAVTSAFLGSVTRDVIRVSRQPVYLAPLG